MATYPYRTLTKVIEKTRQRGSILGPRSLHLLRVFNAKENALTQPRKARRKSRPLGSSIPIEMLYKALTTQNIELNMRLKYNLNIHDILAPVRETHRLLMIGDPFILTKSRRPLIVPPASAVMGDAVAHEKGQDGNLRTYYVYADGSVSQRKGKGEVVGKVRATSTVQARSMSQRGK